MQVNNAPDIDFPAAIVSVVQPGAAPNEMETQVTQRVESAVRGINGVEEINSTVSRRQQHDLRSVPARHADRPRGQRRPQRRSSQIRSNLPEGILEPQVMRVDAENEPISYVGAQTTDMTLEQLSWYIDNTVAKRLLGLEGIAAVERVGGVDRTIRVILDPAALQAQGITAAQVNQQLRQSNMNGAGGRAEIAGSEQSVRVHRQRPGRLPAFADADRAARRPLRQARRPRRRSRTAIREQRSIAKMNGRQVVTFMSSAPRARPKSPPMTAPGRS